MSINIRNTPIAMINGLDNREVLFFIDASRIAWIKKEGVDYSPKIKTLIRIMDTPKEDIYHHYIEQIIPALKITK